MTDRWWENLGDYILGLDLGPSSLGWAIIELIDKNGEKKPGRIVKTGVRRFEAGVLGDIESGRDESKATARRDARGPRRNTWRRQWRMRKLFRKLQHFGLLPKSEDDSADARHELLQQLDAQLRKEFAPETDRIGGHLLPYRLRAKVLDEPLAAHAVGRAIFHLAQRRGFLSNRKAPRDDEDTGVVKKGISELQTAIDDADCRTLGEYFATLDPEEANQHIRRRWTSRKMFEHEFNEIWIAQAPHHACMTDEARAQIYACIFDQRPLKSQRGLIGRCDLEKDKRRAPLACLPAQRFRIWQRLNDIRVTAPDGEIRDLTADEKQKLFQSLDGAADLSWHHIKRKVMGFKKSKEYGRDWLFNFEEGGDKRLVGNRTAAKMLKVLGARWTELPPEKQESLVDEMISFESEEALAKRLETGWGFAPEEAAKAADTTFEQDNTRHSRKAIATLLPLMEQGIAYSTARKQKYGAAFEATQAVDQLPPVKPAGKDREGAFPALRNPAVERAMSELRKVVNAVLKRTGKRPHRIRVELARDLKNPRNRREEMTKRRDENTTARVKAKERILKEMGSEEYATGENILKVRLADECNWVCPFTGRSISMNALMGDQPQFDIEHIIPFSRCLDNSYLNKTLCYHEENRNVKKNETPYGAYHGAQQYDEIIQRVRRFQGDARARKLALFETETLPDAGEFTQKQLSDTRYLSRLAGEYLALLYGGKVDEAHDTRVQVSPGRATAYLRQRWDLNSIIGHDGKKDRADHRHHAIDAIVVALTTPGAVKMLCAAAEEAEDQRSQKLFAEVDLPWDGFLQQANESIKSINVSSRVSKKLNGSLHEASILSAPKSDSVNTDATVHHIRKPLAKMSKSEVKAIVDDRIRELVLEKLKIHGRPPDKVFNDIGNHPHFVSKSDPTRVIPIHSARIRKSDRPISIGRGSAQRWVCPGSNHHIALFAVVDDAGAEERWVGTLVNRFDAMARLQEWKCSPVTARVPPSDAVIRKNCVDGRVFKFSLTQGEHVILTDADGEQRLYRITGISEEKKANGKTTQKIEFLLHTDARPSTLIRKESRAGLSKTPDSLRKSFARKVTVDPLGDIHPARD